MHSMLKIKGGVFCLRGVRGETHRMSHCYWEIFLPGPGVEVGRKFFSGAD